MVFISLSCNLFKYHSFSYLTLPMEISAFSQCHVNRIIYVSYRFFSKEKKRIFLCFNLYVSVFYVMRMIAYATQLLMMPCYGNNIVVNFLLELFYTHFVYFILLCKNTQHKKRTRNGDEDADHQLNF